MALSCQIDSYLKTFETKVKSCEPGKLTTLVSGKKQTLNGYEIILEDTILFPEGGGQPDDRGTIGGHEVLRVTRRGAEAVHFLPVPLDPGTQVDVHLDWTRRFDHMQQHSGQHLLSALAETLYKYDTTSWNLGEKTSFVELDTPSITNDVLSELEKQCNEKIRMALPMYPKTYTGIDDPNLEYSTHSLPADHEGAIRVMIIEGVDENMCCGTHVSNLSHLQAVKILGYEKGKKGKVNVSFVFGDRILQYLGRCYDNERSFNNLLRCQPDQHVEMVQKLQKNTKEAIKNQTNLLRDLAVLEAQRVKESGEKLLLLHRKEGDNEFMNIIHNEINSADVLKFLTVGDEKGAGLFLLSGRDEDVTVLGPKCAVLLEGKGAGKNGRFQGKANKLSNRSQVEKLLKEYLKEEL